MREISKPKGITVNSANVHKVFSLAMKKLRKSSLNNPKD